MKKIPKKNSLGGAFLSLSSAKFLSYFIGLVSSMLLARFRTLEEYGTYQQILLVNNLVTSVIMLGLPSSLNYFLARADTAEEKNKFLSLYYTVNSLLSLMVGSLLVCLTPLMVRYFKNPLLTSFLYLMALLPWTKIITSSVENLLVVFQKNRWLVAYRVSHSVVAVVIIAGVQLAGGNFQQYLIIRLSAEIVYTILVYALAMILGGRLHFSVNMKLLRTVLIFSIPLGLANACGTLRHETDKFFIGLVTNTERLALYSNAAKELPFTMISASLTAVLLPHIARLQKRNRTKEAVTLWKDVTVLSLIVNTFFAIGLFVFAEEAVLFLYSAKYRDASWVFAVYSLTYMVRCTYYGMILNTSGKTRLILRSSVLSLVLNAVLNVAFYFIMGFIGPAVATVVSTIAASLYVLYHTSRTTGIPYRQIFPWKQALKIFLINVAVGAVFFGAKLLFSPHRTIPKIAFAIAMALLWAGVDFLIFRKTLKAKWKVMRRGQDLQNEPEEIPAGEAAGAVTEAEEAIEAMTEDYHE
nr:oligosaccharide flippase family protein [Lachnospiraceae bacterium]